MESLAVFDNGSIRHSSWIWDGKDWCGWNYSFRVGKEVDNGNGMGMVSQHWATLRFLDIGY